MLNEDIEKYNSSKKAVDEYEKIIINKFKFVLKHVISDIMVYSGNECVGCEGSIIIESESHAWKKGIYTINLIDLINKIYPNISLNYCYDSAYLTEEESKYIENYFGTFENLERNFEKDRKEVIKMNKVIGTDNNGKSKIRVKSKYSISLIKNSASDDNDMEFNNKDFENMFEFIDYLAEHGKEIIDDIDNGEYEYSIQINMDDHDFIYTDVLTKGSDISMEIDAGFINKEMQEDKRVLHDISDMVHKRISWGNERNK